MNEWLARLGVGHIVAVDFDRVDVTNLPRIVGATRWDAWAFLARRKSASLRKIAKSLPKPKVHLARRVAIQAKPNIHYDAIVGDATDEVVTNRLKDCDFLFLCSDTFQSRLIFNALGHQYLIPGTQIGVKVSANKQTGDITELFAASRPVIPPPGSGCLQCHELIPPSRLQEEALTEDERRRQRYVDDAEVVQPSVITLNALSAAPVVNDLMMMFTGLYHSDITLPHTFYFARERQAQTVAPRVDGMCPDCSNHPLSRRARGDRARLPCRQSRVPFSLT